MSRFRRFFLPLLAIAVVGAATGGLAFAQTTGDITGTVTDSSGAALPGVNCTATSPALQGSRSSITSNSGNYRIASVPPGTYKVICSLAGFATAEKTAYVTLGSTATANQMLQISQKEEIIVSGTAPVVDTSNTTTGSNYSAKVMEKLPLGRNYAAVVRLQPGVQEDTGDRQGRGLALSVYGSTSAENQFVIDGVNTNSVVRGVQGKIINSEFIQEVEVKTGGYQAEFGRATGGIINVITKSGGNEFHGDVFGYYDNDSLQADNSHPNESLLGTSLGLTREDFGADLGGYIVKDRLWFFGAYDRVHNTVTNVLTAGPNEGEETDSKSTRNLGSGKITWRITPSHSFVASFFQDPRVDTGAINDGAHTLNGAFSTFLGRQDLGGRDWSGRYNGLFGSWVATAQVSLHEVRNSVGPATTEGNAIQYVDTRKDDLQSGGFGLIQNKAFKRYFYGVSLTEYLGHHEFKGGFEYERETAAVTKVESGGQLVTIFDNPEDAAKPIYQHFYWSVPGATLPDNIPISQLNANPKHKTYAAYLQDSWAVLPNLTLNLGVRWDRQQIFDASGTRQIDLKKDYAPRLGAVWDPIGDHRTRVFGSFGRFYEQIPMDLVIRSYSFEQQAVIYNFEPMKTNLDQTAAQIGRDPDAADNGGGKVLGGFTEPSDPNLHGQYLREFLLGAEREIVPNVALGVKYVYRNYGEVIEDFLCVNDGTYCVGNPGEGIMKEIFSLDYERTFPAPKPKRIYRGIQLDVTKRFSNNWSLLASYLWSKLEGNYDGEFGPFTQPRGTADPNISAAYDYYEFFTNGQDLSRITNTGPLSNDRRSQVKLSGVYVTPFNLAVGLAAYYLTVTPVTQIVRAHV